MEGATLPNPLLIFRPPGVRFVGWHRSRAEKVLRLCREGSFKRRSYAHPVQQRLILGGEAAM